MRIALEQVGLMSYILGSLIVGAYLNLGMTFKGDLNILRMMVGYLYITDFIC